jgi:hypothetical protein
VYSFVGVAVGGGIVEKAVGRGEHGQDKTKARRQDERKEKKTIKSTTRQD